MKKITFLAALMISTYCMSEPKFQKLYQADLPQKAIEINYDEEGNINDLVMSAWKDKVKTKDGTVNYKYHQGYSYVKKEGFFKTYDVKGNLVHEKWSKSIDGGVSQEEVLVAIDLFKKNPIVKNHFTETTEDIMIYGGFNFADKAECIIGNRCVHIFASTLKREVLAHSVVRLTDRTVIYPDYKMDKYKK